MDPYEQQLLSVFNSYDISHRGSLDREGLQQLCNSLQLEEQGVELVKCLLHDSKSHVTFPEFKDGLLALLGKVQQARQKLDFDGSSSESESPDREISPKFVYGSKKYGRRSRPESTEQIEAFDCNNDPNEKHPEVFVELEGQFAENKIKNANKVQRSNSQSDVTHSRKRKPSGKLKRCTSFPGNREMERQFKNWNRQEKQAKDGKVNGGDNKVNSSPQSSEWNSVLQSALEQLGVGSDGFLTHLELIRVCEFVGMHKMAKNMLQPFGTKETDLSRRISLEEFIEVLQKDDCIYEVSSPSHPVNSTLNDSCITEDSVLFPSCKTLQYITMGPNGSGVVSSQTLIELWENAGIPSAASLLQELGFTENTIGIIDLATILEDEIRSITDLNDSRALNPHIVLLQASIALYQSEVKYLRSVLEQLSAERDKLRMDIADANQRASLLAQEVDDNHAKMEKSTQNQVRLLEQRHSDMLKELTTQFLGEKEHLSLLNTKLEQKIFTLETEEAKLRQDLVVLQKYNGSLEKENHSLTSQLSELEQTRTALTEKVNLLETECQKISDMERERDQLEPLLEKISMLQLENAGLRDKNDELCTEVETLNSQIVALRSKIHTPSFSHLPASTFGEDHPVLSLEATGGTFEGTALPPGLGAIKRRVDSPSKEFSGTDCGMENESPRLGKMRRCYQKPPPGEVLQEALRGSFAPKSAEFPPGDSVMKEFRGDFSAPPDFGANGLDLELEGLDSLLSLTESEGREEMQQLKAKVSYLEQLLQQHSITLPSEYVTGSKYVGPRSITATTTDAMKTYLENRCKELESILEQVQLSVSHIISSKTDCSKETCDLFNPITQLSYRLKAIGLEKDKEKETSSEESLCSMSTVIHSDLRPIISVVWTETEESGIFASGCSKKERVESGFHASGCCSRKETEMKEELEERCADLEQALEMLRLEFENCENYWSSKLDEERQIFELEQKQNNDKLAELLVKISEYEEQFAPPLAGRLSPIEEKGNLEEQFTELEEEFEDYKLQSEAQLELKEQEISGLKQQALLHSQKERQDSSCQTNPKIEGPRTGNLSNVVVSANIFSSETLPNVWQYLNSAPNPPGPLLPPDGSLGPAGPSGELHPAEDLWQQHPDFLRVTPSESSSDSSIISVKFENTTCSSLPPNISWHPPATVVPQQPHSLNYFPPNSSSSSPHDVSPHQNISSQHEVSSQQSSCRPKRVRKHDRNVFPTQLRSQKKEQELFLAEGGQARWNPQNGRGGGEQTCVVPLKSLHHLHNRLRELDHHCRHLQFILKQQQKHSESVMHHFWQQHREEVNEIQMQMKTLQDKLARSDMLIKDLYVENTYLMANNQRLEHRCHMLVQCSSESTSV